MACSRTYRIMLSQETGRKGQIVRKKVAMRNKSRDVQDLLPPGLIISNQNPFLCYVRFVMVAIDTTDTVSQETTNSDNQPRYQNQIDICSMGVVLFQLAGHEYPIKATSVPDLQKLMKRRQIIRPKSIIVNLLWDLLILLLQFDKKDRPTAEQTLQHPYFTGEQVSKDISGQQRQITNIAQQCQRRGDSSITIYDTNPSYIIPGNEIKAALSFNPDVDLQKIAHIYLVY
ncbi:MAG: hypothetical protein EZS28_017620 [Streblomastix strix]|uniref:Protein kinase domain-containing protein n=1 Tax=Streblomastix strix TaxID=222440 RepID=A0A5J4VVY8_9EUKA|nr:MAG: hypothetical protein EZS28_017620 [Streblomastix strix]